VRRLHPRERIVSEARIELVRAVLDWREKHDELTDGELFSIVGGVLGDQITSMAKYLIREERHPGEPDKPGGLE
jgi:hypothetical protein